MYLCSGLDPNKYCIFKELSLEILLSVDASILKVLCSSGSFVFTDVIVFHFRPFKASYVRGYYFSTVSVSIGFLPSGLHVEVKTIFWKQSSLG